MAEFHALAHSPAGGQRTRHVASVAATKQKNRYSRPEISPWGQREHNPFLDRVAEKRRGFLKSDVVKSYDDFIGQKRPDFARFPVVDPIRYFGPDRETGKPPNPHIRHKPITNAKIYHVVSNTSSLSNTTVVRHRFWPFDTVFECCQSTVK